MELYGLMLGDYVFANGQACKVLEVNKSACALLTKDDDIVFKERENITPITITREILCQNGFKYDELTGCYFYHSPSDAEQKFYMDYEFEFNRFNISYDDRWFDLDIRYIHELQNAIRICNVEKEIDLWR